MYIIYQESVCVCMCVCEREREERERERETNTHTHLLEVNAVELWLTRISLYAVHLLDQLLWRDQ